ncbi:hypothetical protein TcasGA2_TC031533 [Tribolium castaneum]|uniref:Uncharacterized protein n=1 Tax=Tribolium castaneum TaxID=7070 RepID=A0A139WP54_TRICA|nr:hypothetical protein TcasGA2_TC031533 [Tribolium castaneum]
MKNPTYCIECQLRPIFPMLPPGLRQKKLSNERFINIVT